METDEKNGNSMRRYDSVLFDLDGTLTDSGPGIMKSAAYALKELGIETKDKDLRVFVGPPLQDTFLRFGISEERIPEAVALYRKRYRAVGKFENDPYPGIRNLLEELKEKGYRLYVATSKPEAMAVEILRHFEMDPYFERTAGASADDSRRRKEDVIAWLLQKEDVGRAVLIGDTEYDVKGALENGIPCIGVSWGYGTRESMEQSGALTVVNTMDELRALL